MSLAKLKLKYSGQVIPDWELKAVETPVDAVAEPEKKRGRPKKVEEVADGVSDGN